MPFKLAVLTAYKIEMTVLHNHTMLYAIIAKNFVISAAADRWGD